MREQLDERVLERVAACAARIDALGWGGPVYEISAATGAGTEALAQAVMREIERMDEEAREAAAIAD